MGMEKKDKKLSELGALISKLRRKHGKSIEKLAYEAGISKGNLSEIENGKRDTRFSTLYSIAEGLEISVSQLLKDI